MTKQDQQDILNCVYAGAVQETERIERQLFGSKFSFHGLHGHHAAQRIVALVEAELKRKKIFTEVV